VKVIWSEDEMRGERVVLWLCSRWKKCSRGFTELGVILILISRGLHHCEILPLGGHNGTWNWLAKSASAPRPRNTTEVLRLGKRKWEIHTKADSLVRHFHAWMLFRAWEVLTSLGVQFKIHQFTLGHQFCEPLLADWVKIEGYGEMRDTLLRAVGGGG
jgi:hypothetical protein